MAKNDYQLGQAKMNTGRGGRGMRIAEKPKDMKGTLKLLVKYLHRFLVPLSIGLACAVISVLFSLFAPNSIGRITSVIEQGMSDGHLDTDRIFQIAGFVLFLYLFSSLLTMVQSITLATTTNGIQRFMRGEISRKVNRIPLSRFDSSSFGDLLSRVTNDVDTIGQSLNHSLAEIVSAAVSFVGVMIMMLITNVWLALICITSSMIGFILMNVIVRKSQKFFIDRQRYLGMMNGHIEEMYAGHLIVKAFNGEADSRATFDFLNNKLYEANWKSQFLSGVMRPLMDLLANVGYVSICIVGAMMVMRGQIKFGIIVSFILYSKMFSHPLGMVAQAMTSLQSAVAAAERVFSFLGETELEDESEKAALISDPKGLVEFEHVNFGYTPDRTIINDFSVTIKPGQKVAIVGPTGAGKTTLVNLLMRFYEINSGSIRMDGIDLHDTTRENVHDQFCMVLQDTWLFNGTVRENIVYSKQNVPDEDVVKACKAVGLHRFIRSLPDGYDTVLSDSSNLSAGQRQLMTIARAMIDDAPLLILDEATSSVDTRTEQIVQNAMDKLTENRTSFTIAHRLSTIRNADVILVMKDGDIVETGTHNELLEKGGFYADLWTSQFVAGAAI